MASDIVYYDFHLTGKLNKFGDTKTLTDSDAVKQAIQIFFSTTNGEKIHSRSGGSLTQYLGKMIDDNQSAKIRSAILLGLENEFTPHMTVVDLKVEGDKQNNLYNIYLVAYNEELGFGINSKISIDNE